MLSIEDLESLDETLEILSNPALLAQIREADSEVTAGRTVEPTKDEGPGRVSAAVSRSTDVYDVEWANPAVRSLRRHRRQPSGAGDQQAQVARR